MIKSDDGSAGFGLGFRLQQQASLTQFYEESPAAGFQIRRARAQFKGFMLNGTVSYFLQLGMDKGNITLLNAEYRWSPDGKTQITFGQFLPPSGRQFQTISNRFQMIDRSPVARFFFMDWDLGVRIKKTFGQTDHFALKTAVAVTHGEGKNVKTEEGGWAYTGRLDLLPLGLFHRGGDYSESDLFREPAPKLALGTAFYFNQDAFTEYGNAAWKGTDDNIFIFYADAVFKINGLSVLAEYINRQIDNELLEPSPGQVLYSEIISGNGVNIQAGKFITKTLEPTFRVSFLNPDDEHQSYNGDFIMQKKFTLGLNKFFTGHALKLQGEFGYVREDFQVTGTESYMEFLVQFSLSF